MRALLITILFLGVLTGAASATQVKEIVSKTGIKAWLIEEHSLPLVAVRISFEGSGFAYDPSGEEGRANMAAAVLTLGAGNMSEREFTEAVEARAIELTAVVNEDQLEVAMQTLSEHKDLAFSYLGLVLSEPRFDSDAVERTRRQTESLFKQLQQQPGYQLERAFAREAFGDHPYSHPQLGTESSVGRISSSDLRRYAERYLTRENMLVSAVGDITPEELSLLLDKHFSKLHKKYEPDVTIKETSVNAGDKAVVVPYDIPQTLVAFGLPGLKRTDPDYIIAHVMNQLLGGDGTMASKLMVEIREKRGLSYSVYSRLNPLAHSALWGGGFATRNDQVLTAVQVLQATLKNFAEHGPSEKELAAAKRYITGSFMIKLDSNADLAAFLINMQHNKLGIDYLDKRNTMIEAVSVKDVKAMARRLIDYEKLIMVMVGKPVPPTPAGADAVSP